MSDPTYLKAFKELLKQHPQTEDLPAMEQEFYGESTRAVILLSSSAVDIALQEAIARLMRSHTDVKALFDFDRPLGSFSAKIRVSFGLRIYDQITYRDLEIVRELRNGFAHSRLALDFNTKEVAAMCMQLKLPDSDKAMFPEPIKGSKIDPAVYKDISKPKGRFLTTCHTAALHLIMFVGQGGDIARLPILP